VAISTSYQQVLIPKNYEKDIVNKLSVYSFTVIHRY